MGRAIGRERSYTPAAISTHDEERIVAHCQEDVRFFPSTEAVITEEVGPLAVYAN
jgi:hypothetical protein